jgi:hypothetical protein
MDIRKVTQVLKALAQGHEITIQDYTYAMTEDGDLVYVLQSYPDGDLSKTPEKKYGGCEFMVGQFVRLVQTIPSEQMVLLGANTVLTDITHQGGLSRFGARRVPITV